MEEGKTRESESSTKSILQEEIDFLQTKWIEYAKKNKGVTDPDEINTYGSFIEWMVRRDVLLSGNQSRVSAKLARARIGLIRKFSRMLFYVMRYYETTKGKTSISFSPKGTSAKIVINSGELTRMRSSIDQMFAYAERIFTAKGERNLSSFESYFAKPKVFNDDIIKFFKNKIGDIKCGSRKTDIINNGQLFKNGYSSMTVLIKYWSLYTKTTGKKLKQSRKVDGKKKSYYDGTKDKDFVDTFGDYFKVLIKNSATNRKTKTDKLKNVSRRAEEEGYDIVKQMYDQKISDKKGEAPPSMDNFQFFALSSMNTYAAVNDRKKVMKVIGEEEKFGLTLMDKKSKQYASRKKEISKFADVYVPKYNKFKKDVKKNKRTLGEKEFRSMAKELMDEVTEESQKSKYSDAVRSYLKLRIELLEDDICATYAARYSTGDF